MFHCRIKLITQNNCVLICNDPSLYLHKLTRAMLTKCPQQCNRAIRSPYDIGQGIQACTILLVYTSHVQNMVKDDSSDHVTFFHIAVDKRLWFLPHLTLKCAVIYVMSGLCTTILL